MRYWSIPQKIAAAAGTLMVLVIFIAAVGSPEADDTGSPESRGEEMPTTTTDPNAQTAQPETTTPTTTGAIDMEVAAQGLYLVQIRGILDDYQTVIENFEPLLDNPAIGDTAWTVSMAVQLLEMSKFYDRVTTIDPPSRFQEDHALLVDGFSDVKMFSDNFGSAIDAGDAAAMNLLAEIYVRGNEKATAGFTGILAKVQ